MALFSHLGVLLLHPTWHLIHYCHHLFLICLTSIHQKMHDLNPWMKEVWLTKLQMRNWFRGIVHFIVIKWVIVWGFRRNPFILSHCMRFLDRFFFSDLLPHTWYFHLHDSVRWLSNLLDLLPIVLQNSVVCRSKWTILL